MKRAVVRIEAMNICGLYLWRTDVPDSDGADEPGQATRAIAAAAIFEAMQHDRPATAGAFGLVGWRILLHPALAHSIRFSSFIAC